jgi:hypothetical protein
VQIDLFLALRSCSGSEIVKIPSTSFHYRIVQIPLIPPTIFKLWQRNATIPSISFHFNVISLFLVLLLCSGSENAKTPPISSHFICKQAYSSCYFHALTAKCYNSFHFFPFQAQMSLFLLLFSYFGSEIAKFLHFHLISFANRCYFHALPAKCSNAISFQLQC